MRLPIAPVAQLADRLRSTAASIGVALLCLLAVGCSEDERMPIGVPPPPVEYCAGLGYSPHDDQCVFPDATSCELWSFYRGACGQSHSACNRHGGMISSVTADLGTSTAVYALCTLPNGTACDEESFWRTSTCP